MSTLSKLAAYLALALGAATGTPTIAADYTIVLDNMKFGPVPTELHPGDTITWQNKDIFRHSATARDGSFDVDLPASAEVTMVVGEPGSVEFFCKFHPGMTASLLISP